VIAKLVSFCRELKTSERDLNDTSNSNVLV